MKTNKPQPEKRKEKRSDIFRAVDESLAKGWNLSKLMRSAGFFSSAVYDRRTVYNRDQLWKLVGEGFNLDTDMGWLALNILLKI